MAPRTSGSSLSSLSFVQAEKTLDEAEKEMAYKEKREGEEGRNALQHTLEAMSLNKSQVNISPPIYSYHIK